MNISKYLDQVRAKYATGQATVHGDRPALQALFESIDPGLHVINEPRRTAVGADHATANAVVRRNASGWMRSSVDKT